MIKMENLLCYIYMDIEQRRIEFEQELGVLLEKHKLAMVGHISFPRYRQLPEEVLLALSVIQTHGGQIVAMYTDKGAINGHTS